MDMETEFRLPHFHFSTPACIRLNGSSDKPDTTEQIKEDVKCDVGSSEARQTRVQILPLPILNCATLASY